MSNFSESVELSKKLKGYLYSVEGYFYCDFLLARSDFASAKAVATKIVVEAERSAIPLDAGLGQLVLAKCAVSDEDSLDPETADLARTLSSKAVDNLRLSGRVDYLPHGLLARAGVLRKMGKWKEAKRDLVEAHETATRSEMKIHLADCHIESARLAFIEGDNDSGTDHLDHATQIVSQIGYDRRKDDLVQLKREFAVQ
jgi:hypothetical protein